MWPVAVGYMYIISPNGQKFNGFSKYIILNLGYLSQVYVQINKEQCSMFYVVECYAPVELSVGMIRAYSNVVLIYARYVCKSSAYWNDKCAKRLLSFIAVNVLI